MFTGMKKKIGMTAAMVVLAIGASTALVPGTAYAASGDLTITGGTIDIVGFNQTVLASPCSNPGFTTASSPYLGAIDCNGVSGVAGCFDVNITSDVSITKHATATTMLLDNTIITITGVAPGCGSSTQTCRILLSTTHTLTDGAFTDVGGIWTGTFTGTSAVGGYSIPGDASCPAMGLRQLIDGALSGNPNITASFPTTLEV